MRLLVFLLIAFCFSIRGFASTKTDSVTNGRFPDLAKKMRLKTPVLKEGEREVRVWNKCGLCYGDAHVLYVLQKTDRKFVVNKYTINWNGPMFKRSVKHKPTVPITDSLWMSLLRKNILTLPDQSIVFERLYPKPKPTKDTIQTKMEIDGSFTIKAKKTPKRRSLITDGEGYLFEVFSTDSYRIYSYSNPYYYIRDEPECEELQHVVGILNDLSLVFRSDKQGQDQAKAINKD